jgi:putative FmdB family regulatory protein
MPIYEYNCESCNHELEVIQKVNDPELSVCPSCGKPTLKKLISVVGFRLKGSGWYETDFKAAGARRNIVKEESSTIKDGTSDGHCSEVNKCSACPEQVPIS